MSGVTTSMDIQRHDSKAVETEMKFLKKDDIWARVKPYRLRYNPTVDLPRSNLLLEECPVTIYDMRPSLEQLSIDKNGFEVQKLITKLEYGDFFDSDKVTTVYKKEVQQLVQNVCKARHAYVLDHEIRRRHEIFPISTGKEYEFGQPSRIAHIDVTIESAKEIVRELYGELADVILQSRVQCITVWKPLKGPVEDWPLAVCDSRSLNNADVIESDVVYQRVVAENCMIHHNPNQRWFYLDHQDQSEALLFKAADSDENCQVRCAHNSFPLPDKGRPARESIDMRVMVMHADVDYPEDVEFFT